jgi:hypothetical protein
MKKSRPLLSIRYWFGQSKIFRDLTWLQSFDDWKPGMRFALKLGLELGCRFSNFDHIVIWFVDDLAPGVVHNRERSRLDEPRLVCVNAGSPSEVISNPNQLSDFLVEQAASVCFHLAAQDDLDTGIIGIARSEVLSDKDETKIWLRSKNRQVSDYFLEPYIQLKGLGATALYGFRITSNGNLIRDRLVIESSLHEVLALTFSYSIRKDAVVFNTRPGIRGNAYAEHYRTRGFDVPIRVPLSVLGIE